MNVLEKVAVGMTAENIIAVSHDKTVAHFVPEMPAVYATPIMILYMEKASGDAISPYLPDGYVSVGMEVNVKHLGASPMGRTIRTVARVIEVDPRSVLFTVEAWDGDRKVGDGTHRRGVVNAAAFGKRLADG